MEKRDASCRTYPLSNNIMSFLLIILLFWRSCKTSSNIFESLGAPEWIKIETGAIVFSFRTTVTLNPMKCPFVVENPHFKFSFSRCSFGMKCLSLLKSQADGVASAIKTIVCSSIFFIKSH